MTIGKELLDEYQREAKIIGAKQISIEFAIKSICAILALAILVHYVTLPDITNDKLLISIFGGFFLGAGIGLTIRGGAVIDGTEVLAITVSRKSSLTVGDFIAVFNILLFCSAIFLVGTETAMYSVLTYLSASKIVDFIINGIEEYIGVIIVSEKAEEIKHQITNNLGRGLTVFKTDKGFGSALGQAASERMQSLLREFHFNTACASSPWILDNHDHLLIEQLAIGTARAVREINTIPNHLVDQWEHSRRQASKCEIGHIDLFAYK
jgi:hypothetical protein